jgi:hypothetical protein
VKMTHNILTLAEFLQYTWAVFQPHQFISLDSGCAEPRPGRQTKN